MLYAELHFKLNNRGWGRGRGGKFMRDFKGVAVAVKLVVCPSHCFLCEGY
jgi:hypothetical protein